MKEMEEICNKTRQLENDNKKVKTDLRKYKEQFENSESSLRDMKRTNSNLNEMVEMLQNITKENIKDHLNIVSNEANENLLVTEENADDGEKNAYEGEKKNRKQIYLRKLLVQNPLLIKKIISKIWKMKEMNKLYYI